jgi:hypothetical protein
MKLLFRKVLGDLTPADAAAGKYMVGLKEGTRVWVEVKRARNPERHALYWAIIGKIFPNQDRWATPDTLHQAIKIATGLSVDIVLPNGKMATIPQSIAFEKMTEDDFCHYIDRVIKLVCEKIIPGMKDDELRAELELMVGMRK